MQIHRFPGLSVLSQTPKPHDDPGPFSSEEALKALRFHRSIPGYSETPLHSLKQAAKKYHTGDILVKDESFRFGLNAFKGLGGSYCMFRVLCESFGLDPGKTGLSDLQTPEMRERIGRLEFVTATDGNHGRGISWAAKLFGARAHVFLPKGSAEFRRRAIEEAGSAEAVVTEYNYDDTVTYAARMAEQKGWILLQDTSLEGYELYPKWIIQGYLTLAAELTAQLRDRVPTHVFLQAGVGSMAGGIAAYLQQCCAPASPLVTIAEPEAAACFFLSAKCGDGACHSVTGNPVTIMAGLNCGTPCGLVGPLRRDQSAHFCACEDDVTREGMCAFASPVPGDPAVSSGESGALTYGLLLRILNSAQLRALFRIRDDSVLLLINTEGKPQKK